MATITISCPKCEKQIKAPAELEGKKIRCKECQQVFVVTASAAPAKPAKGAKAKEPAPAKTKEPAPAKAAATEEDDDDGEQSYGVTDHSFKPLCPYCAKELDSEDQVVCLHCGFNRQTRERIKTKLTREPTGGEVFVHLLPGIICALFALLAVAQIIWFIFFCPGLNEDYVKANSDAISPYGRPTQVLGTVLWATIGFYTGRFAIRRLIMNPTPKVEEKEK